jgi:hypothetical protein
MGASALAALRGAWRYALQLFVAVRGQGFVPRRAAPGSDASAAEVRFGRQRIVSRAAQTQIRRDVFAALREWHQVMQLEIARFAAALAARVDIGATRAVTPIHFAPHCRGNVPAARAWRVVGWLLILRRGDALARYAVGWLLIFRRGDALAWCTGFGPARFRRGDALAWCVGFRLSRFSCGDALARYAGFRLSRFS